MELEKIRQFLQRYSKNSINGHIPFWYWFIGQRHIKAVEYRSKKYEYFDALVKHYFGLNKKKPLLYSAQIVDFVTECANSYVIQYYKIVTVRGELKINWFTFQVEEIKIYDKYTNDRTRKVLIEKHRK